MPEVSVVIPAFNAAETLPGTLDSVRAQTFEDFEVVVVDDGSTDDTPALAAGTGDHRIRVVSIPNGGVARARNLGIERSHGRLVAFLDADDLWFETKLERQVAALRADPAAGICVTGAIRIDAKARELGAMPLWQPVDVGRALLLHSMIVGCLSSGVVRRDLLAQVGGFNPRLSQSADWDLWLRLAARARFVVLDEALVRYRTAPGNMSSDIALLERDTFAVLDAFFASPASGPYADLRTRAYGVHWLVCAGSYLHAGRPVDAVRCTANAIVTQPASIGRLVGFPARAIRRAVRRVVGSAA